MRHALPWPDTDIADLPMVIDRSHAKMHTEGQMKPRTNENSAFASVPSFTCACCAWLIFTGRGTCHGEWCWNWEGEGIGAGWVKTNFRTLSKLSMPIRLVMRRGFRGLSSPINLSPFCPTFSLPAFSLSIWPAPSLNRHVRTAISKAATAIA